MLVCCDFACCTHAHRLSETQAQLQAKTTECTNVQTARETVEAELTALKQQVTQAAAAAVASSQQQAQFKAQFENEKR
jgi:septal ring factor EnvC (AmiA/AmiB activator)